MRAVKYIFDKRKPVGCSQFQVYLIERAIKNNIIIIVNFYT